MKTRYMKYVHRFCSPILTNPSIGTSMISKSFRISLALLNVSTPMLNANKYSFSDAMLLQSIKREKETIPATFSTSLVSRESLNIVEKYKSKTSVTFSKDLIECPSFANFPIIIAILGFPFAIWLIRFK